MPAAAKPLRIHFVSETAYMMKGQGVHTAFIDCVELLKSSPDVEVVVNNEGRGDVMHPHTYGPFYFWKSIGYKGRRIRWKRRRRACRLSTVTYASISSCMSSRT